jgi:hypothetical protein
MNHLGDTNKMSHTPRTDAARQDEHDPYMAVAAECAKMEKELTECDDLIRRLNDVIYDPHALWANWLRGDVKLPEGIGDVREYQARIQRLEEAGDAHLEWVPVSFQAAWRKAKEAKP